MVYFHEDVPDDCGPFLSSCHCHGSVNLYFGTLFLAVLPCSLVLFYKVKWYLQVFSTQKAKRYGFGAMGLCRPVLLVSFVLPGSLQVRTRKKFPRKESIKRN